MPTDLCIRPEQPSDYAAIDEVNRLAFGGEGEVKLVRAIRESQGSDPALSLVAILPQDHDSDRQRAFAQAEACGSGNASLPHGRGSERTHGDPLGDPVSTVSRVQGRGDEVTHGEIVGHILFSPILIESGNVHHMALALAPMAVHPDYQRRGIGSRLIRDGLDACRRGGHRIVVVLGHAEYYPRFGFERASRYNIKPPLDVPDEAFMVLPLITVALDGTGGTVRYPPSFDAV